MKIKELRENKCMQAALAVLFSVLLCLLAFLLDNRGILGLPGEERGIRQVSGEVTEEWPSTVLTLHPHFTLIADEAALSEVA